MNCAEYKQQLGAYVLSALEPAEMAAMAGHLDDTSLHEGCREALARAELTAAQIGLSLDPLPPSESVWRRIEKRLATRSVLRPSTRWREPLAWTLAAAACAALLVVNDRRSYEAHRAQTTQQMLTSLSGTVAERDECRKQLEALQGARTPLTTAALALLEQPATRLVALEPLPGKSVRASAIVNLAQKRVLVFTSTMPRIANKDFQLWVIRGKNPPVPAGFMHEGPDGVGVGEVDAQALSGGAPDAVAVSLEPLGGRPSPTEVLMAGAIHG